MNRVNFKVDPYEEVCAEFRHICQAEKELKAQKERTREVIINLSKGERMEYGVKVSLKAKQGSVDWDAMVKELGISDLTVEMYRKPGTEYVEVRTY